MIEWISIDEETQFPLDREFIIYHFAYPNDIAIGYPPDKNREDLCPDKFMIIAPEMTAGNMNVCHHLFTVDQIKLYYTHWTYISAPYQTPIQWIKITEHTQFPQKEDVDMWFLQGKFEVTIQWDGWNAEYEVLTNEEHFEPAYSAKDLKKVFTHYYVWPK